MEDCWKDRVQWSFEWRGERQNDRLIIVATQHSPRLMLTMAATPWSVWTRWALVVSLCPVKVHECDSMCTYTLCAPSQILAMLSVIDFSKRVKFVLISFYLYHEHWTELRFGWIYASSFQFYLEPNNRICDAKDLWSGPQICSLTANSSGEGAEGREIQTEFMALGKEFTQSKNPSLFNPYWGERKVPLVFLYLFSWLGFIAICGIFDGQSYIFSPIYHNLHPHLTALQPLFDTKLQTWLWIY